MKLGYTILYVADVAASLSFFERAFGLKRRFLELSAPVEKPWGQIVSYVRASDGCLIELCTPVGE